MRLLRGREEVESLAADLLGDESSLLGAWCEEAAWPETPGEAASYMAEATARKMPLTVSGGLTGIAAGALPEGGAVVSSGALRWIRDAGDGTLEVGAGTTLEDIAGYLEDEGGGLFYPPDPTEMTASLGGTVATDASGSDSLMYGSTRRWVRSLSLVLPGGRPVELRRGEYRFAPDGRCFHPDIGELRLPELERPQPPKNAAGYHVRPGMDLIDLFIGSEGTLALVVGAGLELAEVPAHVLDLAVFPGDADTLWELYRSLCEAGDRLGLRALELMDDRCLDFMRGHPGDVPPPPEGARGALLTRHEAADEEGLDRLLLSVEELLSRHGMSAEDAWGGFEPVERRKLRDLRHSLPESVNHRIAEAARECPGIHKLGSDGAVPPRLLPEYYSRVRTVLEERELPFVVFGHAGQGHLHANAIPGSERELDSAEEAMREIARISVEMGGTVSAEHGLGRLKADYLGIMYSGEEIRGMTRLRAAVDPDRLLAPFNPGVGPRG